MPISSFTHRDGKLRFYDGTGTPYYLEIAFLNADFRGALGRKRPNETTMLDRGRVNANMHMIEGDDSPIMEPVQISFSFKLLNTDPGWKKWAQAMNLAYAATWAVGSNTWVSTKATSQLLSGGESPALFTTPPFYDARRRAVNIEVMWIDPQGTADIGRQWKEVEFPPDQQQIQEGAEEVTVTAQGMTYGSITEITAFTAGTAG